jgi:hypothetical protein
MTERKKHYPTTDYAILDQYTPARIGKLARGCTHVLLEKAISSDDERGTGRLLRAARDGIAIAQIAQQLERGELSQPAEVEAAVAQLQTLGDYQDYVARVLGKLS